MHTSAALVRKDTRLRRLKDTTNVGSQLCLIVTIRLTNISRSIPQYTPRVALVTRLSSGLLQGYARPQVVASINTVHRVKRIRLVVRFGETKQLFSV